MTSSRKNQKSKSKSPLYISLGILALLVASYFAVPQIQDFFDTAWVILTSGDEKRIEQWVSGFGWAGPTILILAMIVQMFLLVIPSILLMVVSILAYGPVWGSLIVFVSVFSASSVGYFIGRYLGGHFVAKLLGEISEVKTKKFLEDYGFWAVIITRVNPFLSNDAISFVGGLLKMGYWKFIGASLLGIAPLTLFIAVIGKSTDCLKSGLLWVSVISLAIFVGYVWWDKRKQFGQ